VLIYAWAPAPVWEFWANGHNDSVTLFFLVSSFAFRPAELLARVRALLRRRRAPAPVCQFGDCEIDLAAHRVRRRGSDVVLTAKEYALLAFFAGHPGRALPRDLILDAVWGTSVFVTPRSIDRCVTTLRAKVEPNPREPVYIQTVRDIGYRFEPDGA
jgi:DNA-binding response OmpR family regulator